MQHDIQFEICALLGFYYAALNGTSYLRLGTTYASHLEWSSSPRLLLDCLTLEDGTDKLSRIVGKEMPFYAFRRKAEIRQFNLQHIH